MPHDRKCSRYASATLGSLLVAFSVASVAQGRADGFLHQGGNTLFPIGCYELPKDDGALRAMAEAGFNMVHCHSREDLDRARAVGLMGVVPLPLQEGATDALRTRVKEIVDHPALAVWEGPDEIVWNFTAYSGLYRTMGVHKTPGEWWKQTPEAIAYAEEQAAKTIPNMRAAVEMIRRMDKQGRPVWINEAERSDAKYVRQYLEYVDITGCDLYPIKAAERCPSRTGDATERWKQVGRGKPVWMVLQGFSWHELGEQYADRGVAYPRFDESRLMAYSAITHGAKGVLYWGTHYLKNEEFRKSLHAVTRELSALQPFLTAPDVPNTRTDLIEVAYERTGQGVEVVVRSVENEWLIIVVNEDDKPHMGIVVSGLQKLNGRDMYRLYGPEKETISHGELIVRLLPQEVKVYATDRKWEAEVLEGRDYRG